MLDRLCAKCKQPFPQALFLNVHGKLLKTCVHCHQGRRTPAPSDPVLMPRAPSCLSSPTTIPPQGGLRSPVLPTNPQVLDAPRPVSPSRFSSSSSHLSNSTTLHPGPGPSFATSSAVAALESHINMQMEMLDRRLTQLLGAIQCLSAPTQAPSSAPPVQVPLQPPHDAQPPSGESAALPFALFFPWVSPNVVSAVALDTLWPECLVALRNPESRVTCETSQQPGLILSDSQFRLPDDSSEARTSAFIKAVPNIQALTQVWLVYAAIRFSHTQDSLLMLAHLSHLEILVEFDAIYQWKAVAEYHLAVCHQRFGTGVVTEWGRTDNNLQGRILVPYLKPLSTQPSSSSFSSAKLGIHTPCSNGTSSTVEICYHYNSSGCNGCSRAHICSKCYTHHPALHCTTPGQPTSSHPGASKRSS